MYSHSYVSSLLQHGKRNWAISCMCPQATKPDQIQQALQAGVVGQNSARKVLKGPPSTMAQQCTRMKGMKGLKTFPTLASQLGISGMRRAYGQPSGPGCFLNASAKAAGENETDPIWQPLATLPKAGTGHFLGVCLAVPRVGICSTHSACDLSMTLSCTDQLPGKGSAPATHFLASARRSSER